MAKFGWLKLGDMSWTSAGTEVECNIYEGEQPTDEGPVFSRYGPKFITF